MPITITKSNRIFRDLDLMFKAHPITGDATKKFDDNAVKASIRHLILTKPFESPFHPEISCQANNLLFELPSAITAEIIKTTIIQVITKFESRVQEFEVTVDDNADSNAYTITVDFIVRGSDKTVSVNTLLYRSR